MGEEENVMKVHHARQKVQKLSKKKIRDKMTNLELLDHIRGKAMVPVPVLELFERLIGEED